MWDHKSLFSKSRTYYRRAMEAEEALFAFWAILGFELLARARLAKVHPSLLSDGKTMSAFLGVGHPLSVRDEEKVRSIPMHEVLARCQHVCDQFTEPDRRFALGLARLRNTEVHTGRRVFVGLPSGKWKPRFFHLTKLLTEDQDETTEELLGSEGAKIADTHARAHVSSVRGETLKWIAASRKLWAELDEQEREFRSKVVPSVELYRYVFGDRDVGCPACGENAIRKSEEIRQQAPMLEDKIVRQKVTLIPVRVECQHCGLILPTNEHLVSVGLGDEWEDEFEVDPVDHFELTIEDVVTYEPPDYDPRE